MKLVKITDDHYVIVDENAEIKEGDFVYFKGRIIGSNIFRVHLVEDDGYTILDDMGLKLLVNKNTTPKITHSTQPLYKNDFWAIRELKLSEVKELIGEVDVEKKAINSWEGCDGCDANDELFFINGYQKGYNQAIEDNKEKKYTEEDLRKAFRKALLFATKEHYHSYSEDLFIQSLQPKTQWDVEFDSQGKLKLKK